MNNSYNTLVEIYLKAQQLKLTIKSSSNSWKFRPKVNIYINPEARCPFCKSYFSTNRIWLVDENKHYVRACWDYVSGESLKNEYRDFENLHPHVSSNGLVCLGNNKDAASTLFTGITPGIHYSSTITCLKEMSHSCKRLEDEYSKSFCDYCECEIDSDGECSDGCSRYDENDDDYD